MIRVYTGFKGLAFSFFFIAGMVLAAAILVWGLAKAIALLLPLLIVLSYILVLAFVCVLLPSAYFAKQARPRLSVYALWMSQALGAMTWMVSFFFIVSQFGWAGMLLVFLFQLLAPVALAAALLKNAWPTAVHLAIWIGFTYGMRYFGHWLADLSPLKRDKGDIIDVDAIEVD